MKNFDKIIRAYSLKNAISHDGTAYQGPIIASLFNEGLKKTDVKKYVKKIIATVSEINSLSNEEQKEEYKKFKKYVSERKVREGLQELPKAKKGKVIMRFSPSASGPLHIGHAATACISFLFVKEYGGKFYLRIEDTNPENVFEEAYKLLEEDSRWLFNNKAKIVIQSDRMDLYYKYIETLIKKKAAFVCTCNSGEFREEFAKKKRDCPCINLSAEDNKKRWKMMLEFRSGNYREGEAVVRFKSKGIMKNPNPAMRAFPLARINTSPHPRKGTDYRVWPLMNLAVAVDDIEMEMSHIVRAKDHRDNALRQKMIYESLGLKRKYPWVGFLGRFKFKDMDLSTTEMREAIEAKKFKGWDDKRLPTLASLRKQGYKPKAFWKLAERIGLSENDKVIDREEYFTLLNDFNRD